MPLIRLLLLAIIGYLLLRAWRVLVARGRPAANTDPRMAEQMVKCATCSLHLPARLALQDGEHWYCCAEHRQAHRDAPSP